MQGRVAIREALFMAQVLLLLLATDTCHLGT